VQALVVTPGTAGSARIATVPDARPGPGQVLLRPLEIGVCGTDEEIADGLFGSAPEGEDDLILGHELLGEVVEGGNGFRVGELVAATVRRSCGRCSACAAGSPDACLTGDYRERGITGLHGFAAELVAESPQNLVAIPRELGRFGVLAEPSSICARGISHTHAIGNRQVWEPSRALVLGAGAIGVLAAAFLRLEGYDVWLASRGAADSDKARTVELMEVRYVSTETDPVEELAAVVSGFDVVIEATGAAEVMAQSLGLVRRNGVVCLLGLDGHAGTVEIDRRTLGMDVVIQNRALFGSVNAHPNDWRVAVERLSALRNRWPEAAERMVGMRVDPARFQEAFDFRGVKATLRFA
jgi:threonine dehydrogenase-like Zn-dependent dehydrogenase